MIVLKFSYHCYSEATRFSHAYIFSPRCKIPHSFENFYNFIYQTTLLSRISCDTISTQNRKLFSTFIVTRKNPFQFSFPDGIFALRFLHRIFQAFQSLHQCTAVLHKRIDRNDGLVVLIDQFIAHDSPRLFLLINNRFFQI